MLIGVPRESRAGETRAAATPKTVEQLLKLGYEVVVEAGAGAAASFDDASYAAAGASVADAATVWAADIVTKINAPNDAELATMRRGAILISLAAPALSPALVEKLAASGVTAMAMDAVPRISRAQSLDVLSSMANIAGYRAVVEAAHEFGSFFTGQVTAAGKVPPARVFVSGAGVAGLAAIGTANSLGAIVRATDVRPEVGEQVESMGAQFVKPDVAELEVSTDGYAKEVGADYAAAAALMYAEQVKNCDIVITTALIPGKPAPRLITEEMVATMKPGSVIVDMAAANGGNVAGSVADRLVTSANGVKIIGYTDLPGRLPTQASQLFGTNIVNLVKLLTPGKDGVAVLDWNDVVVRGMTVAKDGEVTWPPPPVQVSAAHTTVAAPVEPKAPKPPPDPRRRLVGMVGAALLFLLLANASPAPFLGHFMVFMLSVVIGYYVIGNVHHALHTPLMSVTNAISGIIVVGALLQIGYDNKWLVTIIAFVGALVASINVFGGFTVTARMLQMFKREDAA
ncbi:MAG: Re/Si-specific NAD(P)(+) transhydrogenase subunit alpha [Candidatus Phosphoribacter sp.]|nr:Re/Si-specific NAD(P)(+) transhydrogenase subunit alpha [Actinomycetales bacterium]